MVKRTVEVKLPSACPRRHSNPVLIVPLQHYVVVASGSTSLQIKLQAWTCTICCFLFYTCASRPYILLASSQVEHKGFIRWDPALRCGTPVGLWLGPRCSQLFWGGLQRLTYISIRCTCSPHWTSRRDIRF